MKNSLPSHVATAQCAAIAEVRQPSPARRGRLSAGKVGLGYRSAALCGAIALPPQCRACDAADQDFFVLRDQYQGPELDIAYNLHVLGDNVTQHDRTFEFPGLQLHVAGAQTFTVVRHDHLHSNGGEEKPLGCAWLCRSKALVMSLPCCNQNRC